VPFSAYLAQMNLLALPKLLRQICLPSALPAATLQVRARLRLRVRVMVRVRVRGRVRVGLGLGVGLP